MSETTTPAPRQPDAEELAPEDEHAGPGAEPHRRGAVDDGESETGGGEEAADRRR
jgi:hypothetical protein